MLKENMNSHESLMNFIINHEIHESFSTTKFTKRHEYTLMI